MAGDWIKMRTDLYRDPKVCLMAECIESNDSDLSKYIRQHTQRDSNVTRNVTRNAVVGALVAVWGVFRHRGKREDESLRVYGVTVVVLDDVSELHGFGKAMESVGWVEADEKGIIFPRFFEEYNTEPGTDAKKANAERQRRHREKTKENSNGLRNVTRNAKSNAREEKRREEILTSNEVSMDVPKKQNPSKRFQKPTLEELTAYIATRPTKIDPEKFLAHYESNGWRVGKNPMRSWQAAVRTWEGNSFDTGGGKGGPVDKGGYEPAPAMSDEQAGGVKW